MKAAYSPHSDLLYTICRGKMMCYVGAELYGQEYNTKKNFKAVMMQRSSDGQYSMLSEDPKYKKG